MKEQECGLCSFQKKSLANGKWCERFNTKIDVGSAIGVTRQHQILLEHVAAEDRTIMFMDLSNTDQADGRTSLAR